MIVERDIQDPFRYTLQHVESAEVFHQEAVMIKNKAHTFLWEVLKSFLGDSPFIEKKATLLFPGERYYSREDSFIRKLLGLEEEWELKDLLIAIRKFDTSALSVELKTDEKKIAERKSIIFQITKYGTEEKPIWRTRMFIGGIERGEKISVELNQPNKDFVRLKNGLRIAEFISSRALQSYSDPGSV